MISVMEEENPEYQHRRARFDYFKKREESQPYYDSK